MQDTYSNAAHMTSTSGTSVPSLDEDQTAMWLPTAGSVQPGSGSTYTSHNFPETAATELGPGPSMPQDADWDAVDALWGIPESVLDAIASKLDLTQLQDFAPSTTPTTPLTDASSVASPWSTSTVRAGVVPSLPDQASVAYGNPAPPESRNSVLQEPSRGNLSRLLEPNPFPGTGNSYPASWGNAHGHLAPGCNGVPSGYGCAGIGNTLYYPGEWCPTELFGPDSSAAANREADLPMVSTLTTPDVVLGKRPRGDGTDGTDGTVGSGSLEAEGHDPRPRKKGRMPSKNQGTSGVAGSSSRAQYKSATRNPKQNINNKSKAVGRGTGEHAATSAQGLYDRFLPGPSIQQELTGAIAQVLTWVEESAQGEEPQQQVAQNGVEADAREQLFPIPRSLRERYSKLLAASEEDWERGTVNELRCQLCPHVHFSTWEGFKRHCDTTRVHPWDIFICDHCGDYFGRSDSFKRHSRRRPRVCQKAVPERAEAKGRDIKRLHQVFKAQMVHCLDNGGEIGTPFFRIVKAKYPSSSKTGAEDVPSE